jgi:hypothetical protein
MLVIVEFRPLLHLLFGGVQNHLAVSIYHQVLQLARRDGHQFVTDAPPKSGCTGYSHTALPAEYFSKLDINILNLPA